MRRSTSPHISSTGFGVSNLSTNQHISLYNNVSVWAQCVLLADKWQSRVKHYGREGLALHEHAVCFVHELLLSLSSNH